MDYPLRKMSVFLDFLTLQFSGLKIILFYPKDQKPIFSDLLSPKTQITKSSNLDKNDGLSP